MALVNVSLVRRRFRVPNGRTKGNHWRMRNLVRIKGEFTELPEAECAMRRLKSGGLAFMLRGIPV